MEYPVASDQALVVGVSRYQHISSLKDNQDVPGVRDVLANPRYCAYPPERVKVLAQDQATRANILEALERLCDGANDPGSRTFFYFSGHGGQDTDRASYILPVDTRRTDYPQTAISARDLSSGLRRCKGEVTVVLDCCFAAGIGPGLAGFGDSFRSDMQAQGRVVFAASRADGYAYGAEGAPYGIFTGHMLDALRGAASTNGGNVTVRHLFDYVQQRVILSSGQAQRPSFIANTEAFYDLTRYPEPIEPSAVFEKDVYISYDRGNPTLREWVKRVFQPELERHGCSIWPYSDLGYNQLKVEEAIVKSRYVVALLTPEYLQDGFQEFTTTMAVLQAIDTRTPRFIHIQREMFRLPLWIRVFVGLDMTARREMEFHHNMEQLVQRLKKQPHQR
jgi:hypothetical protein